MSLSSSSTIDDAIAQYNDNLSWEGNITKATAELEAVRYILVNRPRIIATNNRNFNFDSLASEQEKLEQFVSSLGSSVNRCSFVRGKMLL